MTLPFILAFIATIFFGILAIIYTLKEHKLQRRLKEKEKFTAISLINSLEDAICIIDEQNQITAINQAAKNLLNLNTENPSLTDVLSALPNSYNFHDKIQQTITSRQKIQEKEIHHQDKILNITLYPIHTNDSSSQKSQAAFDAGALLFIHDITKEKPLTKMKEDFTNIIVHELRSPLTSLKASSEMLYSQNNLTDEEKKRLFTIISEETTKMLEEISIILDAAKLDSGLFTIQKTNANLKKLIEDTANSYQTQAQNKFINLTLNIDPLLPTISIDEIHIRRVLTNLLTNSFKFTPRGGTVTLHAWRTSDKILVSVSDTGEGIPHDKQHLCFTKFSQIKTPNATVGTGLGLYISKGIIEAHGGTISLQSEPAKGTTITFTLPNTSSPQTLPLSSSNTPEKPINPLAN